MCGERERERESRVEREREREERERERERERQRERQRETEREESVFICLKQTTDVYKNIFLSKISEGQVLAVCLFLANKCCRTEPRLRE